MTLFVLLTVILLGGFVLEAAFSHLPLVFFKVDLAWLVVVFLGFFVSLGPGGIAVFLIGLAQESLGGSVRGILPLTYLTVFFFLRLSHQHLFFQGGSPQLIWVVILTVSQKALEGLLIQTQGYEFPYHSSWDWLTVGGSALVQGIASLLVFLILKKGVPTTERYGT